MGNPGKIQETFINADLFNIRSQAVQKVHHAAAVRMIKVVVGRCHYKIWTFLRHSRQVRLCGCRIFCRDGFGEDNAVACLLIAADDGRDFSQIRTVSCFKFSTDVQLR